MELLNGLSTVLGRKKYLILFIAAGLLFSFVYVFAWNLILIPNFYLRADLWTPLNILYLVIISFLSSMVITLEIFSLKMKLSAGKGGFFAIVPAFFTSACPVCAPLILSFTSATFAIGLSIAQFGVIVKILTILVLSATILYISSILGKCKIKKEK